MVYGQVRVQGADHGPQSFDSRPRRDGHRPLATIAAAIPRAFGGNGNWCASKGVVALTGPRHYPSKPGELQNRSIIHSVTVLPRGPPPHQTRNAMATVGN